MFSVAVFIDRETKKAWKGTLIGHSSPGAYLKKMVTH